MTRTMVSRIKLFLILVALSTLVGVADGYRYTLSADATRAGTMFVSGVNWLIGSSITWFFEIFFINSRYGAAIRRLHFIAAIGVKSAILIIIVAVAALIGRILFTGGVEVGAITEPWFFYILGLVFLIVIVLQTVTQVIRIIGGRTLFNFLLGKYHQPVHENKIFMFLDLEGSTALAVQLGDIGVQKMITKFFFDITEPIIENGGEIHRYIGDEVIVTWPLKDNNPNTNVIDCCFAISDLIGDKAEDYEKQFATIPTFRIGLHGGPVVMSECGDQKQEISYFGDTINTASRIEQQCKNLDSSLLISGELLEHIDLSDKYVPRLIGTFELRGRALDTELYTIDRKK